MEIYWLVVVVIGSIFKIAYDKRILTHEILRLFMSPAQ